MIDKDCQLLDHFSLYQLHKVDPDSAKTWTHRNTKNACCPMGQILGDELLVKGTRNNPEYKGFPSTIRVFNFITLSGVDSINCSTTIVQRFIRAWDDNLLTADRLKKNIATIISKREAVIARHEQR